MARSILSEYGPDSVKEQKPSAKSGGVTQCKELPYSPPKGPMGMDHEGPGLGGDSCGDAGTQGKY